MMLKPQTILVTGGAGFIGSHTCLILLENGYKLVVLDNFMNSSPESLKRVVNLLGGPEASRLTLIKGDIRSTSDLDRAFATDIDAVIHFAGLKSVSQSIANPLDYWDVNVEGSIKLLNSMQKHGCRTLVFSSSATLYGIPETVPIKESTFLRPINPYGNTKLAVEKFLEDIACSDSSWRIACLRYFNPVGAHPSGKIGEDPQGIPSNLFPFVAKVAIGQLPNLKVFGDDWPTPDGTGVRDYIHVMDLAKGHEAALKFVISENTGMHVFNLGCGRGYSVLEVVSTFEKISGKKIPIEIVERRVGDSPISVADVSKALRDLNWSPQKDILDMCTDAWRWQVQNPNGFKKCAQIPLH